jgi:hypothetical protein
LVSTVALVALEYQAAEVVGDKSVRLPSSKWSLSKGTCAIAVSADRNPKDNTASAVRANEFMTVGESERHS